MHMFGKFDWWSFNAALFSMIIFNVPWKIRPRSSHVPFFGVEHFISLRKELKGCQIQWKAGKQGKQEFTGFFCGSEVILTWPTLIINNEYPRHSLYGLYTYMLVVLGGKCCQIHGYIECLGIMSIKTYYSVYIYILHIYCSSVCTVSLFCLRFETSQSCTNLPSKSKQLC